jgi:excisionase family DNA binding protein
MEKDECSPYSIKEGAKKLGVDTKTIREAIDRKQIVAVRIGRRILLPRGPFDRMLGEGE